MGKQEKAGVLMKDKEFVKYKQLLKKAKEEGRLSGRHTCTLCGMRYHSRIEAEQCCRISIS